MKTFKYFLLSLSLLLCSCEKTFLDLKPISNGSVDNFYKSAKDIDQAVSGAYDDLQSTGEYGHYFVYFMEVSSDNSKVESTSNSGGIYGDFDVFRVAPTNSIIDATWKACYNGIQRCNTILSRIDAVPMDQTIKDKRIGEAKFIRALTYFNLVRIWGPVSLVTKEVQNPFDAFKFGRDDTGLIYQQIIQDLSDASTVLPAIYTGADIGRATKGAAQTLLGKVYLTLKRYTDAAVVLKIVITSNTYQLLPNYGDVFKVTNKNNKESIFEVQFLKGGLGEGSSFLNIFAPSGSTVLTAGIGTTMGNNVPTTDMQNAYAAADLRKAVNIGKLSDGRLYVNKYLDVPFAANDAGNNFMVLRYADVLLMYAEALNEIGYAASGDAFDNLNLVHSRAGLTVYKATDLPDQGSFRLAVEKERRLELAFENHRWFDLQRTGRALDILNASGGGFTAQSYQLLYPIPQSQIDANPSMIKQNPGY